MRAILVRHGETPWNKGGRFQGQGEVGLSRYGLTQSRQIAKALVTMDPVALFSSPLARTMDTSRELSRHLHLPIVQMEGLKEINLGKLEGINGEEMRARYPHIYDQWHHDPSQVVFPEGESLSQLQDRAWQAIKEIEKAHPDDTITVVSHNFAIRTIISRLLDIPLSRFHLISLNLGSISIIELNGDTRRLVSLNEHFHLSQGRRTS